VIPLLQGLLADRTGAAAFVLRCWLLRLHRLVCAAGLAADARRAAAQGSLKAAHVEVIEPPPAGRTDAGCRTRTSRAAASLRTPHRPWKAVDDAQAARLAERVRAEFLHAWSGYRQYAWGQDALRR